MQIGSDSIMLLEFFASKGGMIVRILFIGNDREIVRMTGKILRRNGYDVYCVIGVDAADMMQQENSFDLVIVDIEMSDGARREFCEKMRRQDSSVLLFLISHNARDEIPALRDGADDWIKKPYQMDVLLARISALLRKRRIQEANIGSVK